MIVWLASYPRSGNTLLRTTLLHNFGLQTHSLYDDTQDIAKNEALALEVGHVSHGLGKEAFYAEARDAEQTFFVKTHEPPLDGSPAIYIVRDGRSAAVSYFHYIKAFAPFFDVSLEDIVFGACLFGAWSDHYLRWKPDTRPDTLVLRYEDLVAGAPRTLQRLADFVGKPFLSRKTVAFDDLKSVDARFFRAGSDTRNVDELTGETLDLFWLLHGPLMKQLGYGAARPLDDPRPGRTIRSRLATLQERLDALGAERRQWHSERSDLQEAMRQIQDTRWWRVGQKLRLAEAPLSARSSS